MNKNETANVQQPCSNQYMDEISLVDIAVGLYKYRLNWLIAFVLFFAISIASSVYLYSRQSRTFTAQVTLPYYTADYGKKIPVIPVTSIVFDWATDILPQLNSSIAASKLSISDVEIVTKTSANGASSPVKIIIKARGPADKAKARQVFMREFTDTLNSFYGQQVQSYLDAINYSLKSAKTQMKVAITQLNNIKTLVSSSAVVQFMALSQRQFDLQQKISELDFKADSTVTKFTAGATTSVGKPYPVLTYVLLSFFLSLFLATAYVATLAFLRQVKAAIKGL